MPAPRPAKALALLAALFLAAPGLPGPASADELLRRGDTLTYVNARFGTTARFPADLFPEELPAPTNGDGRGWASTDAGADLFIYARPNGGDETPRTVIADRAADDSVTYRASGRNWAVVSGFRDGRIFYERYIFRGELIHSVSIRYPESERRTFDRLVGDITNSLRGPSSAG